MAKRRKKKNNVKLKPHIKGLLLLLFAFLFYITFFNNKVLKKIDISNNKLVKSLKKMDEQEKKYQECISKPLDESNFDESTLNKKKALLDYVQSNGLRFTYEDLKTGYQINNLENSAVYGASLAKIVDALYLIDNDIDLSQTMVYKAQFVSDFSEGMRKRKVGESITLGDLMKYAISVSDNTAHHMLVNYIGKNKLKEYANSLGAKSAFTGNADNFGNQTSHDTNIYLKKAYELFETKENGKLLKEYMTNKRRNNLDFDDVQFAHKYGSVNNFFHETGINVTTNPYTISVLTTKGYTIGPVVINKTSRLTKEFNDSYYANRETYCQEYSKK